jgi:Na+/pantothenate symporter
MSWVSKLQARWGMEHRYQVWLILVVFACTGLTVMFLKPVVVGLFVEPGESNLLFSVLYYVLILPVYNVILLVYGFIFGLFQFFWEFEKRTFRRIFRIKRDQ